MCAPVAGEYDSRIFQPNFFRSLDIKIRKACPLPAVVLSAVLSVTSIFAGTQIRVKTKETRHAALAAILLTVAGFGGLFLQSGKRPFGQPGQDPLMPSLRTVEAAEISAWEKGAQKVTEDRGEAMGKRAKIEVPAQLKHDSDSRRFLAVQVAEWRKHQFETPRDYADLAGLIRKGEFVELEPVSDSYILYGVGGRATGAPFTVFDKSSSKSIALLDQVSLEREYERIAEAGAALTGEIESLKADLSSLPKKERAQRKTLQANIAGKEKALKQETGRKELLDAHYGNPREQRRLFAEYEKIETLAKGFGGLTYDLADADSRQRLKERMLRHLRPEALHVMEGVAVSYRQKFDRPLPVSSLVRPDEYQYELSKVNPNATRIAVPPHSTGLAFDIFNKYMTAEEQQFVMTELARLEDEGRIEVLRENRDHFHVFAFRDGTRPAEKLVRQSLGKGAESE